MTSESQQTTEIPDEQELFAWLDSVESMERRRSRYASTEALPGATEFSRTPELASPEALIQVLRQAQWLDRALNDVTRKRTRDGRKRKPGRWDWALVAFTMSNSVDIQPWLAQTNESFWVSLGFRPTFRNGKRVKPAKPSYSTTYERFVAMEKLAEEIQDVAGLAIQHAMRHDPLIGCHVHLDGTEAESNAALIHDCDPREECMKRSPFRRAKPGEGMRPQRATTEDHKESRHDATQLPADEDDPLDGIDEIQADSGSIRVKVGGHWYRCRDTTAGARAYTGDRGAKRFWLGYYDQKATDHRTGAPLAAVTESASLREHTIYEQRMLPRLERNLGRAPQTVIADRGFSLASTFEMNTRRGIASVIPWRQQNGHDRRRDHDTHDRHGVPRCRHCGGPTRQVRFNANSGKPRLWFDCLLGHSPECGKTQTMSCSADWRVLVPLWRTEPLYHELREARGHYDNVHALWRRRYKIAPDDTGIRPRRIGSGWQQLRASVALIIEWLRILYREGWLGSARREKRKNMRELTERSAKRTRASRKWASHRAAEGLLLRRSAHGLCEPYGKAAVRLGIGDLAPPSERTKSD